MAVIVPVVIFIGPIPKVQHLTGRPLPHVVRLIKLGTREDLIEPALTLGYYVS
jgi:hypothetical protein